MSTSLPDYCVADQAPAHPRVALVGHGPSAAVPLPLLQGPKFDCWRAASPVQAGEHLGVQWRDDGEMLFLHLVVPNAVWAADPATATEAAYRRLDAVCAARKAPCYWRVWNYLGGIIEGESDLERYRQFTLGRHRAWASTGLLDKPLPAATAIGCASGLHVFALAGRFAAQAIENPRQVSAWRYPRDYGVQPPSFARASLLRQAEGGWLFVSGTASIVGHESRHAGDVAAQFVEARANLDAVLDAAAAHAGVDVRNFSPRNFKLYWSRSEDATRHTALSASLSALAPTQVLQGVVCRRELAVEIEALYWLGASPARS